MIFASALPSTPCCAGTGRTPTLEPSSPCWLPIWGTSPWCPLTTICTGSNPSERQQLKYSPATTVNWLCPYRTGKEGSNEEATSQPTGCHSARLLHRPPATPSRTELAHHPQLPRQGGAVAAISLRAQPAARGGARLEGSRSTGNPCVPRLSRAGAHNTAATRNVRLSGIHALFRFVASRNPEHLNLAQRVLGIPLKRAPQRAIDY